MTHNPNIDYVSLRALDEAQRAALVEELYAVHSAIFDGVDRAAFRRYVVDSSADETRLAVFRAEDGAALGYCALHLFWRVVGGQRVGVMRSEVGVLPALRGSHAPASVGARAILGWRLRFPFARLVAFACFVHPSGYLTMTRRMPEFWPRPGQPTPAPVQARMLELADDFGLPRVEGADPLVREVGWRTREAAPDAGRSSLDGDYFIARNPTYAQGHGLLFWGPFTWRAVAWAGLKNLSLMRRARRRRRAAAPHTTPRRTP